MTSILISSVGRKMRELNAHHVAVIFVVTGPNGTGKTVLTKRLLTDLPFHQTFNLGAVAKTIRYIYQDEEVSRLENFTNKKITRLFTPIVQFACREYQKNGVNVIVDGVQIDTGSPKWDEHVIGGVVLSVKDEVKFQRNQHPETHFNRKMDLHITDNCEYTSSDLFEQIDNTGSFDETYRRVLEYLSDSLDKRWDVIDKGQTVAIGA